jgi:hypothetical protein
MTRFEPGSIVRLKKIRGEPWSPRRLEYVFVLLQPTEPFSRQHPELRVAPISFEVNHASNFDLICAAGDGGLIQSYMVELWNQRAVLVDELENAPIGAVGQATLASAYAIHNTLFSGAVQRSVPCGAVGTPIEIGTDPRIEYQNARLDLAESLSQRAEELAVRSEPSEPIVGGIYAVSVSTANSPQDGGAVVKTWRSVFYGGGVEVTLNYPFDPQGRQGSENAPWVYDDPTSVDLRDAMSWSLISQFGAVDAFALTTTSDDTAELPSAGRLAAA